MKFLSPRNRIAAGLTGAVVFVICLAKISGYIPDQRSLLSSARTDLSETVALGASSLIVGGDVEGLESFLEGVTARNDDVMSFAVRLKTGELAVETGDHGKHWVNSGSDRSTESQIQVPIYCSTNDKWGTIEIRFTPPATGALGYAKMLSVGQMFFIGSSCFLIFSFILSLVLKHLDPSKAVPQRVRDALDNLAEGLLILDTNYNILLANSSFARVLGRKPEKLVGVKTSNLEIMTEDVPPWETAVNEKRLVSDKRVSLRDVNGNELKYMVNCSPLLGHKGNYCGVMVTFDDVTQLEEAIDAADAANQAKSDFLANMSHEIRTPMNAILGFTDVLRRGMEENPEQRMEYLNTIHSSGSHLIGLINEILDLSKVEAGKLELEMHEFTLPELLHNVIQVLSSKSDQKDIDLGYEVVGKIPPRITSDSTRIKQILINLVGNAVKFTDRGGVKLCCEFEQGNIRFNVIDTGIGMTSEQMEKIFDPFSQADSSTTRRYGGTGLGLSICKKFTDALDGSISVKSELGAGTIFSVCLPVEAGDSEFLDHNECQMLLQLPLQSEPGFENTKLNSGTVLVVDDGQANRHIVKVVLQKHGLKILEAENGKIACDLVQQSRVDIVLMDMQMPVMDGYTATRNIRESGFAMPILALTGNVSEKDELRARAAGCNGLLPKPINIDQMVETIGEFIGFSDEPLVATDSDALKSDAQLVHATEETTSESGELESWTTTLPMDDEEFYQIVAGFVDNLGGRLQGMQKMIDKSDMPALVDEAHWLKGAAGTVGLGRFTEPSAELEKSAGNCDVAKCQQLLNDINKLAGSIRLRETDTEKVSL